MFSFCSQAGRTFSSSRASGPTYRLSPNNEWPWRESLAEPPAHAVDIEASFDEHRAARVPKTVKGEARLYGSCLFQLRYRLDERRVEATDGPRCAVGGGRDRHGVVRWRHREQPGQIHMNR